MTAVAVSRDVVERSQNRGQHRRDPGYPQRTRKSGRRLKNLSHTEVFELRDGSQSWSIAMRTIGDDWLLRIGFRPDAGSALYAPRPSDGGPFPLIDPCSLKPVIVGFILVSGRMVQPRLQDHTTGDRVVTATDIAIVALLMGLFVHQTVDSSVFRYHWAHFVFVYLLGASAGLSGSRTNV